MPEKRPALGKGLSALIPDAPESQSSSPLEVDIDSLEPSRHQPRLAVEEASLKELAQSIRQNGVIQPILVRRVGPSLRIIAGERRWRASRLAGLTKVPVIVRDLTADVQALELALVENIQRENLNPIDEAVAYQRLADEYGVKQDQIAQAMGKDRSTVANAMRLLKLPETIRAKIASGVLSPGHARALLVLEDPAAQERTADEIISRGVSVREAEALVRRRSTPAPTPETSEATPTATDVHTRAAEDRLRFVLGTRVRIVRRGTRGRIEVDFASEAELIRLFEQLTARERPM